VSLLDEVASHEDSSDSSFSMLESEIPQHFYETQNQ